MINAIRTFSIYFFLIVGTYFLVSAAVGMIRFPDFYTRLHAGSKCLIAGGVSILLGCIILQGFNFVSLKLLVIIIFLLITNPVAIHAIARSAYKYGLKPQKSVKNDLEGLED